MFDIEYRAGYSDSYEITGYEWDKAMEILSFYLAKMVDDRLITQEEFEQGMNWVTGVVVEDAGVRVPATFGDLTIALTLTD